jgi:DNA-binding PadR family transcriptional regulator
MTEKELRNKILLAIYKHRDSLDVLFSTFCKDQGFKFESDAQLARVLKFLHDKGYVKAMLYEGGDGIVMSITSSGVDAAEELITSSDTTEPKIKAPDREKTQNILLQKPKHDIDVNQNIFQEYNTGENYQKIQDENVAPCFDIDKLAESFVRQIDTASDSHSNNVCMIGDHSPGKRKNHEKFD